MSTAAPLTRREARAQRAMESVVAATVWTAAVAAPAEVAPLEDAAADVVRTGAGPAEASVDDEPAVREGSFELLEPVDDYAPAEAAAHDPAVDDARQRASDLDEFERAALLFSFTGETPVQSASAEREPAAEAKVESESESDPTPHVAPRVRRARPSARRITTTSFSVGVIGIVGLLTVGMTTPADAVALPAQPGAATAPVAGDVAVDEDDIQAYVAPATIENATIDREEGYSTVSLGQIAADENITNYSDFFVNDPNAAIQWPFAVGVPITYGFGWRSGAMHEGADFVPGEGADIQAIAAGTVRLATNSGGGYGVEVVIDHIIDGKLVSSRYAHMLYGSIKVVEGQHVEAGTILGNTGNTGHSFGAHTHFEILIDGTTAVDPIAWLREYAGRASLDHP